MRLLKRLLINLIFILSQNMRFCCSEKSFLYSPLSVCNYYYYYSVFFFFARVWMEWERYGGADVEKNKGCLDKKIHTYIYQPKYENLGSDRSHSFFYLELEQPQSNGSDSDEKKLILVNCILYYRYILCTYISQHIFTFI